MTLWMEAYAHVNKHSCVYAHACVAACAQAMSEAVDEAEVMVYTVSLKCACRFAIALQYLQYL